ncbi:hypothetical protein AAMO2058_000046100 [Amorphochlora amoebiformis]
MGLCVPTLKHATAKDLIDKEKVKAVLDKNKVAGMSLAWFEKGSLYYQVAGAAETKGDATSAIKTPMTYRTMLEVASLSKTVASAFAVEYFASKKIPLNRPVTSVLKDIDAEFKLVVKQGCPREWADQVQLRHLMDHTGLGMHYVYGIPLKDHMPTPLQLMKGNSKYGYPSLLVEKEPGIKFGYSGGGFIMLQYIIETIEGRPIHTIMAPFLDRCGMKDFSVSTKSIPGKQYATGYLEDGKAVDGGRLMFPPLAAGMMGSPVGLSQFLMRLGVAFKDPTNSHQEGISHGTARMLLKYTNDKGSMEFMGAKMGLGVFVARAGPNRIALHQAANDGFRGLYVMCFDGPNAAEGPTGFVLVSNGNNNAMFANCELSRMALEAFGWQGIDWKRVDGEEAKGEKEFKTDDLKQEEIVNRGLKEMVFDAFEPKQ